MGIAAQFWIGAQYLTDLGVDFPQSASRRRTAHTPESTLESWHRGSLEREQAFEIERSGNSRPHEKSEFILG
jgi:hypothetical protein